MLICIHVLCFYLPLVDGAIHNAAGDNLYHECKSLTKDPETGDRCNCGESKITCGYNLPAKCTNFLLFGNIFYNVIVVIHTVGPRGEKPELLKRCYCSVLNIAKEKKIRSIALCGISMLLYD
jgi:O-acetyl-ADP-ribose deacetylase (regulator of RNase III)